MSRKVTKKEEFCFVAPEGDLTIYQVAEQHKELLNKCEGAAHVVVDLSKVEELDLAGLQMLLALEKQQNNKGGSLSLTGQTDRITQTMEVLNLSAHFKSHGE